jgi:hypothetical protein
MNANQSGGVSCESARFAGTGSSQENRVNGSAQEAALPKEQQEQEDSGAGLKSSAPSAGLSLRSSQATIENTALPNAPSWQIEQLAQNVRYAGDLCDLCATAIAQSLVAIKRGQDPALHLGQVSISGHKRQILTQSLALFVESLGNTDTIPTMATLKMWYGYVENAMRQSTQTSATENECAQTRFRYSSKASRRERERGLLGHIPCLKCGELDSETHINPKTGKEEKCRRNGHPTVKPLSLMRWLCRLTATPTGGSVLDPFLGSGPTGVAAVMEGRDFIGIEIERESFEVAEKRIAKAQTEMVQARMLV